MSVLSPAEQSCPRRRNATVEEDMTLLHEWSSYYEGIYEPGRARVFNRWKSILYLVDDIVQLKNVGEKRCGVDVT
eukprot:14222823-Ditylum_brightwellii.AAC.1